MFGGESEEPPEEPEGGAELVPSMTSEKRVGVLPVGARVAPDAARALQKALDALGAGLVVSAWSWTEKARAELDRLTDSHQADDQVVSGTNGTLTGELASGD